MITRKWRRVWQIDNYLTQLSVTRIGAFRRAWMLAAGQKQFALDAAAAGHQWTSAEHVDRVPALELL